MPLSPRASARRTVSAVAGGAVPLLMLGALPAVAHAHTAPAPATTTQAPTRTHVVRAGENPYRIAETEDVRLADLLRLNGLTLSSEIQPGQVLVLGGPAAAPAAPDTTEVERGEGWWQVSRRTGVPAATLQRLNGMSTSTMLHPGMVLLTAPAARQAAPAPSAPVAAPAPAPVAAPATPAPARVTYTVRSGDSMWSISQRFEVSIPRLRELNGLSRTSTLHPGDVLVITDGTEVAPVVDGPVGSTFLDRSYPAYVTASANDNLRALQAVPQPSPEQIQAIVRRTAVEMGVDPALALGHAYTESRFRHASVSPSNAVGTMQVIPVTGEFASDLVGRELDLLDPQDNITAGVALIRYLQSEAPSRDLGIAAYYQGVGVLRTGDVWPDTRDYVARVKAAAAMF